MNFKDFSSRTWSRPAARRGVIFRWELLIGLAGLGAINIIFLSPAFRGSKIEPGAAGLLGDFVGGYVGTMFGLVSILLLIHTLRSQQASSAVQGFEDKYFTLLTLHRKNVSELNLGRARGRKVFVLLMREFRQILPRVRDLAVQTGTALTQDQLLEIAYYCLFFGTGPNSSRMLRASLSHYNSSFVDALVRTLKDPETKRSVRAVRQLGYVPFEGHQSRLGHYFRHLYQTVVYIDQQDLPIDRYEYAKTVRAQLSTHEQALLLINARTPLGANWWQHEIILRYRMVQNLPRDFFDARAELDVENLFPSNYFEWQERSTGV